MNNVVVKIESRSPIISASCQTSLLSISKGRIDCLSVTTELKRDGDLIFVRDDDRFKVDGSMNRKLDTRVMAPVILDLSQLCNDFTTNPIDVTKGLDGLVRR